MEEEGRDEANKDAAAGDDEENDDDDDDDDGDKNKEAYKTTTPSKVVDLGVLGWRYCKSLLMKVATDRKGRRGSSARFLVRFATSSDVVMKKQHTTADKEKRPNTPKGWSPNFVYGPGGAIKKEPGSREQQRSSSSGKRNKREQPRDGSRRSAGAGGGGWGVGGGEAAKEHQPHDFSWVPAPEPNRLDMPLKSQRPAVQSSGEERAAPTLLLNPNKLDMPLKSK